MFGGFLESYGGFILDGALMTVFCRWFPWF